MADNLTFQSGTLATVPDATVVATDDGGAGGHVQLMKLAYSADGSVTKVQADADGVLVNLGANNDVTVTGLVSVTGSVAVTDNAGSLTVDAPVGTPVFVRLSDGAAAITTLPVSVANASSATLANVSDAATSAQLLASNAARKGFSIFNDSTSLLYVKFGTTAATTDYTVRIDPYGYFEHMGAGIYTGRVDGIWSADASGAARVTEW